MNKKMFTLLFLAVFVLAQFGFASAAPAAAVTGSLTDVPVFSNLVDNVTLNWSLTGLDAASNVDDFVLIWSRKAGGDGVWDFCQSAGSVATLTAADGTMTYDLTYIFKLDYSGPFWYYDQDLVEFRVTTDQYNCYTNVKTGPLVVLPTRPSSDLPAHGNTFVDAYAPEGFNANPPYSYSDGINPFSYQHTACNTFEMWALVSENRLYRVAPVDPYGYSGFDSWNASITGTFAPPAPLGPANAMLSWAYTFPSTASGPWSFEIHPEDVAGNYSYLFNQFREELEIEPDELLDCASFSDVNEHEYELYVRYLSTLGLISGYGDGNFGPDNTLTRAEAATLFEISNGYDTTNLPEVAPDGCNFPDVSASDWFAGWVWQACADGFMNGLANNTFGPADLLTRGQIVTVMNNIAMNSPILCIIYGGGDSSAPSGDAPGYYDGYLATPNVMNCPWGTQFRDSAWTDVYIGDYYAQPIINAYGVGVAEGTSANTFSPNEPVTRGEFARMLYRGLSVVSPILGGGCCFGKSVSGPVCVCK